MTQNNLGVRSADQAGRTEGSAAVALLAEAEAAYRAALEVYTRDGASGGLGDDPEQPRARARRPGGADRGGAGAALLAEAVAAFVRRWRCGPGRSTRWTGRRRRTISAARSPTRRRGPRAGGGVGAARRGGGGLRGGAGGRDPGGASGGMGDDAEQPRRRARRPGRADRGERRGARCWPRRRRPTVRRWRSAPGRRIPVDWAIGAGEPGGWCSRRWGISARTAAGRYAEALACLDAALEVFGRRATWSRTGRNARAIGRGWPGSSAGGPSAES